MNALPAVVQLNPLPTPEPSLQKRSPSLSEPGITSPHASPLWLESTQTLPVWLFSCPFLPPFEIVIKRYGFVVLRVR
ncbi:MAG: hypothetical protein D4R95_03450 [Actinobacteria bacterium]|nr:MAG: hypothetical protein D4R95_03450 [Actinomycetota bacterium]